MLVLSDDGRVMDIVMPESNNYAIEHAEFFSGALVPGFVNAHCHIELSHLQGKVGQHTMLDGFLEKLMQVRAASQDEIIEAAQNADTYLYNSGCIAVGDISNGSSSFGIKAKSKILYHTFVELFGLSADVASTSLTHGEKLLNQLKTFGLEGTITPHAPYSVSDILFTKLIEQSRETGNTLSIHHQESESEKEFFISGTGPIEERLKKMKISAQGFKMFGESSAKWISSHIHPNQKIMLVHNTFTEANDVDSIQQKTQNAWFCLCPKANMYISNRLPDLEMLREKKCQLTLGTDSLASNNSLDMLDEMRTIQTIYPAIELNEILQWASLNGAKALGLDHKLGSFTIGKRPGIVHISEINPNKLLILPQSEARML